MLTASLSAADGHKGVDLALTISNDGDEPTTLRFRTGQRADFAAYPVGETGAQTESDPVWRHGAGRMFTQVLGSETLEAGESVSYEATWPDPPAGTYRVVGTLTAEEPDVEAAATVEVD